MREVKRITLQDGDNTLEFEIKPMAALNAERWMLRAVFVLNSGLGALAQGSSAQEIVSALSTVDFEKAAPLWDELLSCCQIRSGGVAIPLTPETVNGKIEFPTTIFLLKVAAVQVNFGFFGKGGFAKFLSTMRGVLTC